MLFRYLISILAAILAGGWVLSAAAAGAALGWQAVGVLALTGGLTAGVLVLALLGARARGRTGRSLLAASADEITALSVFPIANPEPVLKVSCRGEILWANPAARKVLDRLGVEGEKFLEGLGEDRTDWLAAAVADGPDPEPREVQWDEMTFRCSAARFAGEQAVLISAADVTRLKQLEDRLRRTNEQLEQSVLVKSFDLLLTQDVTIMSLVALAETRDSETGAHIDRTRKYVQVLAEKLEDHPRFRGFLDAETIRLLYRSAPLHDIGKVGIPDKILLKPGKLAPAGFEQMKKHPILGGDALRWAEQRLGSNSFLQIAREIAYYHHEHWDGSGYPYGISGEQIPIAARLMALADVYDALRSERRYKSAYDHARAREIIISQRGHQFDPDVVDAFLAAEDEFQRIAREHPDHQDAGQYVTDHTALEGDGHIPFLEDRGGDM